MKSGYIGDRIRVVSKVRAIRQHAENVPGSVSVSSSCSSSSSYPMAHDSEASSSGRKMDTAEVVPPYHVVHSSVGSSDNHCSELDEGEDKDEDTEPQSRDHAQIEESQTSDLAPDIPSVGSIGHDTRTCKPCMFVSSEVGCWKGVNCTFCHFKHGVRANRPCKAKRSRYRKLIERRALTLAGENLGGSPFEAAEACSLGQEQLVGSPRAAAVDGSEHEEVEEEEEEEKLISEQRKENHDGQEEFQENHDRHEEFQDQHKSLEEKKELTISDPNVQEL